MRGTGTEYEIRDMMYRPYARARQKRVGVDVGGKKRGGGGSNERRSRASSRPTTCEPVTWTHGRAALKHAKT